MKWAFFSIVMEWFQKVWENNIADVSKCEKTLPSDMEFVQNFTPTDFQAKNFTPSISPNFNSFSVKKHKK